MRILDSARYICACTVLLTGSHALAQQWEVGGLGGGGFYLNNSVTGSRGSGNVGFKPGFSGGAFLGHNSTDRIGGEIRYLFQRNDMKVSSGGTDYTFGGMTHAIHYDVLIHTRSVDDVVRPFIAIGGGVKGYRGTGKEVAFQPLSNLAILTRTHQWQPMLSVGGGVKWAIGDRTMVRVEIRDYVTQIPTDVILPAPGAKFSGWIHSLTPLVGISYTY
jgi:hypothetical protein